MATLRLEHDSISLSGAKLVQPNIQRTVKEKSRSEPAVTDTKQDSKQIQVPVFTFGHHLQ